MEPSLRAALFSAIMLRPGITVTPLPESADAVLGRRITVALRIWELYSRFQARGHLACCTAFSAAPTASSPQSSSIAACVSFVFSLAGDDCFPMRDTLFKTLIESLQ